MYSSSCRCHQGRSSRASNWTRPESLELDPSPDSPTRSYRAFQPRRIGRRASRSMLLLGPCHLASSCPEFQEHEPYRCNSGRIGNYLYHRRGVASHRRQPLSPFGRVSNVCLRCSSAQICFNTDEFELIRPSDKEGGASESCGECSSRA